jgi:hypothetical protein
MSHICIIAVTIALDHLIKTCASPLGQAAAAANDVADHEVPSRVFPALSPVSFITVSAHLIGVEVY